MIVPNSTKRQRRAIRLPCVKQSTHGRFVHLGLISIPPPGAAAPERDVGAGIEPETLEPLMPRGLSAC